MPVSICVTIQLWDVGARLFRVLATEYWLPCTGHCFQTVHSLQYRLDDILIAHGRVDHHVIEGARWPVGVEVVLDIGDAVFVYVLDEVFGFGAALSDLP